MAAKTLSATVHAAPFIPGSFANEPRVESSAKPLPASVDKSSEDSQSCSPDVQGTHLADSAVLFTPTCELLTPGGNHLAKGPQVSKAKLSADAAAFIPGTSGKQDVAFSVGDTRSATSTYASPSQLPRSPGRAQADNSGFGYSLVSRHNIRNKKTRANYGTCPYNPNSVYLVSPGKQYLASEFIGDQLRKDMQQRTYLSQAQLSEEAAAEAQIPPFIQNYHSLYPLEDMMLAAEHPSSSLGVRTCLMKGISVVDGGAYTLRRIDGLEVEPSQFLLRCGQDAVKRWSIVANHPNLVGLRNVLASSAMKNVLSLYIVHDYHPGSVTLDFAHIQSQTIASEDQLWSYLVHLSSAIRAVHSVGLTFRPEGLTPTQVLLTSNGRIRVSSCGIFDALEGDPLQTQDMDSMQRQDLTALGRLILNLACAGRDPGTSLIDHCALHYSVDLVRLINALLAAVEGGPLSSWHHLVGALSDRSLAVLDSVNTYNDGLIKEMTKEVENGRLMRLVVKLSMINERDLDGTGASQWSETGDQYMLKLFRDYVFHQTNKLGLPVVDWGHVIECLNKLDAGVPEQIILMSKDERSLLVVTYADVKRRLETVYSDMKNYLGVEGPRAYALQKPLQN